MRDGPSGLERPMVVLELLKAARPMRGLPVGIKAPGTERRVESLPWPARADVLVVNRVGFLGGVERVLSLIHISEPTRLLSISYAVFCLKKKKTSTTKPTTRNRHH